MQVTLLDEVQDELARLAETGSESVLAEISRLFGCIKTLETYSEDYWSVAASDIVEFSPVFFQGNPLWRLCPTHVTCVALIARVGDVLFVLAICSRADVENVERMLTR